MAAPSMRFAFQGICYEYRVLPFGLSLTPRVCSDWLLLVEQEATTQTSVVVKHLTNLGIIINTEKSVASPLTCNLCGLSLDSVSFTASLAAVRMKAFRRCLTLFVFPYTMLQASPWTAGTDGFSHPSAVTWLAAYESFCSGGVLSD